jgi:hypothetical protein
MKAAGDKKRLPISDTQSLMDREVPTPEVGGRDQRSFLIAVGRPAKALAAAHVLRLGAAILGPGVMLLHPGWAAVRAREPLIQPSEICSENGVLKATISAAPGTARRLRIPRISLQWLSCAAAAQATPWRHHADHLQEQSPRRSLEPALPQDGRLAAGKQR